MIKARVTQQLGGAYRNPEAVTVRRQAKGQGSLWQHRYWEHWLRDEADVRQHLDYLHFNPVKHGLVSSAAEWPWPSFHRFVEAGVYPGDWGGMNGGS